MKRWDGWSGKASDKVTFEQKVSEGSEGGDETIGSQEEFWVSVKLSVRFNLSLHT